MQGNSWWAHSIQEIGKDNHHGICLNQSLFDGRIIMSHDKYVVLIDINDLSHCCRKCWRLLWSPLQEHNFCTYCPLELMSSLGTMFHNFLTIPLLHNQPLNWFLFLFVIAWCLASLVSLNTYSLLLYTWLWIIWRMYVEKCSVIKTRFLLRSWHIMSSIILDQVDSRIN